jgi:flagellar assembly protein FliH
MATIIKREHAPAQTGPAMRGVAYNLDDLAHQADDYLEQVRREAMKIVDEARREAAAVRAQAEEAGRAAAEKAIDRVLDEKVAKQMQSLTPALKASVAEILDAKQSWLEHWERSALEVALRIAERIVRGELTRRPELAADWIRQALELAAGSGDVTIRLNPADHAALRNQAERLAALFHPLGAAHVVADPAVAASGCKVITAFGEVDMQLETQLARVAEELSG